MFQVDYLEPVLGRLATAWVNADEPTRRAITAAANIIDSLLQRDPHNVGESRPGGRRILFEKPLAAIYRFEPDGRTVTVVNMWLFKSPRKP